MTTSHALHHNLAAYDWQLPTLHEFSVLSSQLYRIIALLSESAPLSFQLKARFLKFMFKDLGHDNSTLEYVTNLSCQNPMSVSGTNWRDCINFAQDISMISMNVKQVYGEWYDTISDNEIDSVWLNVIFLILMM